MNQWTDGILRAPDKRHVREIPQRTTWSSSLWISQYGDVWRRIYNCVSREWYWTEKLALVEDGTGRQGLKLPHFVAVEYLICMAWRCRQPDTPTKVYLHNPERSITAQNLRWQEEDDSDEPVRIPGETWRPVTLKIGLVPCDSRYQISNFARLKNPEGQTTVGFWWDGRRWAAIAGCGLLDLTSSARGWRALDVPKSIEDAMDALGAHTDPADYADERGIQERSAWSAYAKAAPYMRPSDLRNVCREVVASDLWRVLSQLKTEKNAILGSSLTELMEEINERLPGFEDFELRFEQLRLARMAIVA
jgi:hypothetical protein